MIPICLNCDMEARPRSPYCSRSCMRKFNYRRKTRAEKESRLCEQCGVGEVWKDYAIYCGLECRAEANRIKQRKRNAVRLEQAKKEEQEHAVKSKRAPYRRAASLAEASNM